MLHLIAENQVGRGVCERWSASPHLDAEATETAFLSEQFNIFG